MTGVARASLLDDAMELDGDAPRAGRPITCPGRRSEMRYGYGYGYEQIPGYGHLPPRFVPHVVRAEWAYALIL